MFGKSKPVPPIYQLKAFLKGDKPGVYDAFMGTVRGDRLIDYSPKHTGYRWRRYYRIFGKILRKYQYLHVCRKVENEIYQVFYIYRGKTSLMTQMLNEPQKFHKEIGLAVGIPEFAVMDFVQRKTGETIYRVKIKKLGLVFTMRRSRENLNRLEVFLNERGLKIGDADIK